MNRDKLIYIFLFILTILSFNYFFATFLPGISKIIRILFLSIFIGLGFYNLFITKKGFALPIQLLSLSILFSILISYLTYGQSIQLGYLITFHVLLWPIFFLLLKMKIKISQLETVILFFGILYSILYFYQFANPTNVMFNVGNVEEEFKESQFGGIIRIVFPAAGIFWLAVYIATCRITGDSNLKWLYLILIILGLILPAMQQLRSYLIPTLLVYIYHFGVNLSLAKKSLIGFGLILMSLSLMDSKILLIDALIEKQQKTASDGSKDIRVIAASYYLFEFSPTTINRILGNGMGHQQGSYGQFLKSINEKGLFIADIGIIGVYAYFGVIPILAWAIIGYKVYTIPIPRKYMYVKYYFFSVLFGALPGSTLYHVNFLMANIFALYIFQYIIEARESEIINKIQKIKKYLSNKGLKLKDIQL